MPSRLPPTNLANESVRAGPAISFPLLTAKVSPRKMDRVARVAMIEGSRMEDVGELTEGQEARVDYADDENQDHCHDEHADVVLGGDCVRDDAQGRKGCSCPAPGTCHVGAGAGYLSHRRGSRRHFRGS